MYVCIYTCVCICMCKYTCMCVCVCVYVCIYIKGEVGKNQVVLWLVRGFPGDSVVKNMPANTGDASLIPGLGRSPGEQMAMHSSILA